MKSGIRAAAIAACAFLAACEGGASSSGRATFSLGGTVSGLAGAGLVLSSGTGQDLAVTSSGAFAFPGKLLMGTAYAVTVKVQPRSPLQTCTVTGGSGRMGTSDVTTVMVSCVTAPAPYTLGGVATGVAGAGLVLSSGAGEDLAVNASGAFTFATPLATGTAYAVTVKTQPTAPWQTCTVLDGTGTVGASDVTTVSVDCTTNRYAVGGAVSGLAPGTTAVLQDNGGDDVTVAADGSFVFPTRLASGSPYDVTVAAQPTNPWQTCAVVRGQGILGGADVTDVSVACTTNRYAVGGTVSGLSAGATVVLQDNGGDDLAVTGNGAFTFATAIPSGSPYAVTVLTQPAAARQTCTVTAGSGTVGGAPVTSVVVTCVSDLFTIGGTVTGLAGAGLVLQDNGGDDLAVAADGAFTFATPVARGGTYAVTVLSQPVQPAQTCTVAGGSGTVTGANVTSVSVTCVTNPGKTLAVIASFTGRADFAAGTLTISVQPVGGASAAPVTLALAGAPWLSAAGSDHGCGPADPNPAATVWGADVGMALRNLIGEVPAYSGLYAVITTMLPATGFEPCSAVPPANLPSGIVTTYGAFPFATLDAAIRPYDTRAWAFRGPGTGTVSFSGSILGAEISDGPPWVSPRNTGLAASATRVYYPTDTGEVAIVDAITGAQTLGAALLAPATVLAASSTGDRVWVATDPVGGSPWIQALDAGGAVTSSTEVAGSQPLAAIVGDPMVTDRAWFVAPGAGSQAGQLNSIRGPGGVLGTPVSLAGSDPFSLAFGPDGNVYVVLRASRRIQVCTPAGSCNPATIDPGAVAGCEAPVAIILGPDVSGASQLWFTSTSGTGAVCTLDPAAGNAIRKVASTAGLPDTLVVGPDGNVWVTSMAMNPAYSPPLPEGILERLLATGTEVTRLAYVVGEDAWQVVTSGTRLWVIHRNSGGTLTSDLSRVTFLQ